jgi:DNA polymerase
MGISVWQRRAPIVAESVVCVPENTQPHIVSQAMIEPEKPFISNALDDGAWTELENEVKNCTRCDLCKTRTQTVFGTGNKQARWLIIGEAPGQSEDEQGKPFVGVAGQLLTEMLKAIALDREQDVYIANILKCRPPNNRDPHVNEVTNCINYLQRQQALIKPDLILAVGRIAAQNLLQTNTPIGKLRGQVHDLNGTPLIVVYHPAYLLRSLIEKRKAWQDLLFAIETMEKLKQ